MTSKTREVKESPLHQGEDEVIAYKFSTTPWDSSSPASPSAVIKDADGTDVTSTNMSGSASVASTDITTPSVTGLTAGAKYRVEVKWTDSGNTLETFWYIYGQE